MVDAALISGMLLNLAPLINDEFSLFWSFKKEVQKLLSTLSSINAVLEDAEIKNMREKDKQMEDWLRKLKVVAYEVRDIMDECRFEDLRLQVKRLNASSSSTRMQVTYSITQPFSNTWTRLKIGHKIKDVQEKLDQISSERERLHLREYIHRSNTKTYSDSWRESISVSTCSQLYGRDSEKKKIVDMLVNTFSVAAKNLSVMPIVGIGGLGKTTLAQMVFNDDEVTKHFHPKIWVCVSEEFDIKLVLKAIIDEKTKTSLEELQKKVRLQLKGKRYLIVLDDVWSEDREAWDSLRSILDCGSNGAFVLTTTRKKYVAEIMKTTQYFELSPISDHDCWLLFEERAFMNEASKTPNLIDIGKEIVRSCKGVPLVSKTLGGQLRFKSDEKEWCIIRDSEIWEMSQNEKSLLPILRLSYYDLPYHLRRCFAYCAIFPKDTIIQKERLIQMWMAHGLIPTNENQEVEDVGNTIWNELHWRSFFQENELDLEGLRTICKMHDLMHDLAQSVMKEECYIIDAKSCNVGFRRGICHVTIMVKKFDKEKFGFLKESGGLQSIVHHPTNYGNVSKEILNVLKEFPSLRVFEISRNVQYQDLRNVRGLKHLRYLNLSGIISVTTLPNSICDLLNLQTLNLNYCSKLESLPRNLKDLINLRHLYIEGCNGLKYMPRGMGQLKHLKTLSLFVIGKTEREGQLDELKELDIGGSLVIKNLERVSDASIAKGVSMARKSSINKLELEWKSNEKVDDNQTNTRYEEIGEALEVSTTSLKILKMRGYKGVNLPKWVGKLYDSSLTRLELVDFDNVKHIFAINNLNGISLLEELTVGAMMNLRELVSPIPGSTTNEAFPHLSTIQILHCPNLHRVPPSHFKSLNDLTLWGECCNELLYSISNLSGLTRLSLNHMGERSVLFPADKALMVDHDNNNIETQGGRSSFQSLRYLKIHNCDKLICLFDEGTIIQFPSLQILKIYSCPKLGELGGRTARGVMMNFNSLMELHINDCPELMISLKDLDINLLQYLYISDCPKLVSSEEADDVTALLRSLRARLDQEKFCVDILNEEEELKEE
ncbi:putative disease resistance protein RGA1 [Impatiens glandulifera]|uniref:putative disease resistance protein RGA1 n=1 Tax=Impatiens glandulifera TaxID=253017 RepID=UPI001FB16BC2|nr:putative disease resistance protein RGA1 [Impatiens glandulifera]